MGRGHFRGGAGGAFGKGGAPHGGRRDYGSGRTPSSPHQPRYTSIEIGQIVEVHSVEQTKRGNDYTVALGGNRVFITGEPGMTAGWSGKIKITGQNQANPKIYYAQRYTEPVKATPSMETAPAARPTIDAKLGPPTTKPAYQPQELAKETISVGDLGATEEERAVVYVDVKARGMPFLEAMAYLIRNGQATSQQGQSILKSLQSHLEDGRPLYEVAGAVPDEKKTLGQYLDEWKAKGGLEVEVGEKEEKIKPPAAAEVVERRKPVTATAASAILTPKRSVQEPMPVSTGGRKSGAALENLVSDYQTRTSQMYHS